MTAFFRLGIRQSFQPIVGHCGRILLVSDEEPGDDVARPFCGLQLLGMVVETLVHELLQGALLIRHAGRESRELLARFAHLTHTVEPGDVLACMVEHVIHHQADLATHQFAKLLVARDMRETLLDRPELVGEQVDFHQVVEREETRAQPVVNVVIVIGNVVRDCCHLRLK